MSEEILKELGVIVENAVDKKINGNLKDIKRHLEEQDKVLGDVKVLLEERKFLVQLWAFIKFLGGVAVSVGGAYLLYEKLKNLRQL